MQFRELRFAPPDKVDSKSRAVPVTVSSETPVDRGPYVEILDHSPGAVDLSRAPLPLIEQHDNRQLNIGVIEGLQVVDGKLRGVARFGRSARADEVLADVRGGIVRSVSIGYELLDNGTPVAHPSGRARRFKFRPLEVSAVSVPADATVGFYRSLRTPNMQTNTTDYTDFDQNPSHDTARPSRSQRRAAAYAQDDAGLADRERCTGIMALATRHGLRELGERAIAEGTPLETFRGQALDVLHYRGSHLPLYQPPTEIGLSDKEVRQFSLTKLYRSILEPNTGVGGFERDCVRTAQQQAQRAGMGPSHGGMILPYDMMRAPLPGLEVRDGRLVVGDRILARDLSSATVGGGGAMVATDLLAADFIEHLRARTLVINMGARRLSGLVGNVTIPRQTGTTTMSWVAQGGAASESDAQFASVTLTMKTAHGMQDVTRDLLIQGTPAVEGLIRADLLACMAVSIDHAALNGTGASNQPTGVFNTAGIGAVAGGTNGAAPTWDHMVALEEAVATANADRGEMGYLTNPKVRSKLKRTQKFSGTNGQEIFERAFQGESASTFGVVNGYRCGITNNVRSDLTKGTASGVCSAMILGAWSDLLIGEWMGAEILPDQVTQAANRIVRMHVYQSVDIAVRRAQSFAAMTDILTT